MATEGPQIEVDGETRPYEYVAFPKHVYNAKGEMREVGSERELAELGDEWKESPDEFARVKVAKGK